MAKLTEKQKRFVDYYIETGNASEAARKAGYSKGSIATANKWLIPRNHHFKPDLAAAIDAPPAGAEKRAYSVSQRSFGVHDEYDARGNRRRCRGDRRNRRRL